MTSLPEGKCYNAIWFTGMRQFQHKQAQKFSLLADWKQNKTKQRKVKMEYDEFQHNGAPRPLGLSLYFALVLFVFLWRHALISWDLKWTHVCAVLVLPYSFQVL